MTSTLYRDGRLRYRDSVDVGSLLVRDGQVGWVGSDPDDAPVDAATTVIDLGGALVLPAFVDAHIHATSTGLALTGLDLTGAASLAECLQQVEKAGRQARGGVVLGHGWDETTWPERRPPTRQELDRASYGGVVYLSRIDVHSAVVSSALLAATPEVRGADGWAESGHLTRDAHHVVRRMARDSISPARRRALQQATLEEAARLGVASVHEMSGPDISGAEDLTALLDLANATDYLGPEVVGYWGESAALGGVVRAQRLGAIGAAGDLFADGSIGSHTAALRSAYADADHNGHAYLTAADVRDHVVAATEAGLQAGFHAIGDAALDVVVAGLIEAEHRLGTDTLRQARHRIEHLEMPAPDHLPVLARLGVVASVQPAFDRLWGGRDGMYAERLGVDRALTLNPFAAMAAAGVTMALGSDSPVTPLDPWGGVRAAVHHQTDGSGLRLEVALVAHTRGGLVAARQDGVRQDGVRPSGAAVGSTDPLALVVGDAATFAVWEVEATDPATGLPALAPGAALPRCLRTVRDDRTIYLA